MLDTIYEWTRKHERLTDDGDWTSSSENADELIFCTPYWKEEKVREAGSLGIWNSNGAKSTIEEHSDDSADIELLSPDGRERTLEHFEPIDISDLHDEEHEELLDEMEMRRTFPYVKTVADDGTIEYTLRLSSPYVGDDGVSGITDEDGYCKLPSVEWVTRPENFDE